MKISAKQLRLLMLGLLALSALAFVAITYLGLGAISKQSVRVSELKLKNETLDAQLVNLGIARKEVAQYSYFNDVAKTVLPSDKDQAKAVLTIFKLAQEAGISVGSITFPTSSLGGTSKATGSAASAISQAKPVQDIKGLYSLQLTITPDVGPLVPKEKVVTYAKFKDFLQRIERDRRTAQITQVNIQPDTSGDRVGAINFSLTINIFMRPEK
jgi:hypothetical protein